MIKFVDRANNFHVHGRSMNAQAFIKQQTGGSKYGATVLENEILTSVETGKLKTLIAETTRKSPTARRVFKDLGGYDKNNNWIVYIVPVSNEFAAMQCVFSTVETKSSAAHVGFVPFKPDDSYSVKHPIFQGFTLSFPQSIVLFHELGHAVQWISRNTWYNAQIEKGMKNGYFEDLEKENLKDVEWPMCKEMGVDTRRDYLDIVHKPPTIVQLQ